MNVLWLRFLAGLVVLIGFLELSLNVGVHYFCLNI
jgi:hypothetical protein